jgi:hypothetical protein
MHTSSNTTPKHVLKQILHGQKRRGLDWCTVVKEGELIWQVRGEMIRQVGGSWYGRWGGDDTACEGGLGPAVPVQ